MCLFSHKTVFETTYPTVVVPVLKYEKLFYRMKSYFSTAVPLGC